MGNVSGYFLLDWAIFAVSLFNTVILLWLGLTVLLNAERRDWGVYATGGGMLMGAAFFVSHTAILGLDLSTSISSIDRWWHLGWLPAVLAPYAWYVVTLWYAGFWNEGNTRLRRRQRLWYVLTTLQVIGLVGLMGFANPLPSYQQIITLDFTAALTVGGVSVIMLVYPVFIVMCVGLSIDTLRRPEPNERVMGDIARQRARPWFIGASLALLAVSLLVAGFVLWLAAGARGASALTLPARAGSRALPDPYTTPVALVAALFDVVISSLIALAVLLLGQGLVSYEVFTGKTLPRRGFFRHWRSAVILAAGYGGVIGGGLARGITPIYSLLLTAMLMVAFYALFGWRSFVSRERFMWQLRPFASSPQFIERVAAGGDDSRARAEAIFEALCRDVLGADVAALVPLGGLAQLAGQALRLPADDDQPLPAPPPLPPGAHIVTLDEMFAPYRWAIPLWAERGLIGALLLDEKQDGGLYTQEEIEVAQATGERVIDMLAGEEMARRLLTLQRQRMAQSHVMDRRTRRTLHDDVLPNLHAAILSVNDLPHEHAAVQAAIASLSETHRQIADLIHSTPEAGPHDIDDNLEAALRRMLATEFAGEFDSVVWESNGVLPQLDALAQEVVYYALREAVRNAALHGRGGRRERPLTLRVSLGPVVQVEDDGVGYAPNGEQTQGGGAGGGLALHSTLVAATGGSLAIRAGEAGGTLVEVGLPPGKMAQSG